MERSALFGAVLVIILVFAVPALAQVAEDTTIAPENAPVDQYEPESVGATGMIGVRTDSAPWYPEAYGVTDSASGTDYALTSESVDLSGYLGRWVTVYGTVVTGTENNPLEGGPALLNVTRVEEWTYPPGQCLEFYAAENFCATFLYPDGTLEYRTPAS